MAGKIPLPTKRAAPEGMQPAATAPKDGTKAVVWREGRGLYPDLPVPAAQVTHWKASPKQPPK
jgi:hypothetical protein